MRRWLREHRQFLAVFAAVVCGLSIAAAAHFQSQTNRNNGHRLARIADVLQGVQSEQAVTLAGQILGCERLNVQIVRENRASLSDYLLLKGVQSEFHGTPAADLPPFFAEIPRAVGSQSWIAPTSCVTAVKKHGSKYHLNPSIRFVRRLPPKSVYKLPAGE